MKHRILAFLLAAAVLLLGGCRGGAPAESAPESAAPTVWRYAALGDSIPAGYGLADGEKSYPERLRDQIGAAYDRVEFSNFAVSGYTTAQLEAQVSALLTGGGDAQRLLETADAVTICIGGNNLLGPLSAELQQLFSGITSPADLAGLSLTELGQLVLGIQSFLSGGRLQEITDEGCRQLEEDLPAAIGLLREHNPDACIVLMTVYNPYDGVVLKSGDAAILDLGAVVAPYMEQLCAAIRRTAEENGCRLADAAAAFADAGSASRLVNAHVDGDDWGTLEIDPHPTAAGHELLAEVHRPLLEAAAGQPPVSGTSAGDSRLPG